MSTNNNLTLYNQLNNRLTVLSDFHKQKDPQATKKLLANGRVVKTK